MTEATHTPTPVEESAEIRHHIADTRAAMVEKLGSIENQVVGMVQGAASSVAHTFDSVKETLAHTVEAAGDAVQGTVKSMKHVLDIRDHVRKHPWLALGAAVAVGLACGRFFSRR